MYIEKFKKAALIASRVMGAAGIFVCVEGNVGKLSIVGDANKLKKVIDAIQEAFDYGGPKLTAACEEKCNEKACNCNIY